VPATLTQPLVAQVWNNNGTITTPAGTPFLTLTGHTTSASNTITITAAPGESFQSATMTSGSGDPFSSVFSGAFGGGTTVSQVSLAFSATAGVSFSVPASSSQNTAYFNISDSNVTVSGLQIKSPNATDTSSLLRVAQTATVQDCILDGFGQGGGAAIVSATLSGSATNALTLVNCLVVDRAASPGTGAATVLTNYGATVANCTFVAVNSPTALVGLSETGGSGVAVVYSNNIAIGYAAADVAVAASGASVTVDHGLFSAASLTGAGVTLGAGNLYGKTAAATFVSATADFRVLPASAAPGAGATDTAAIPSATDIYGLSRPAGDWTIGAYQLPSADAAGALTGVSTLSGSAASVTLSTGTATGVSTLSGVALLPGGSVGSITGVSTLSGVTTGAQAAGLLTGTSVLSGVSYVSAVTAVITLAPVPPQDASSSFEVTGTYTIYPTLSFSDDATNSFAILPVSVSSPLGQTAFGFDNPGQSVGVHTLAVTDTSTAASAALDYVVSTTVAPPSFPPTGPTGTLQIIPAFPYDEYVDDDDIGALFASYNAIAQSYLDWFNGINLPIYTGAQVSGALLDWVATGLYGYPRPTIAFTTSQTVGPFNTYDIDTIAFNARQTPTQSAVYTVTDDIYKRLLTWHFYKGDGQQFNIKWLKRRVVRFLAGVNGTDVSVGDTSQVSVAFASKTAATITISEGVVPTTYGPVFQAALQSGALSLPFQIAFSVILN